MIPAAAFGNVSTSRRRRPTCASRSTGCRRFARNVVNQDPMRRPLVRLVQSTGRPSPDSVLDRTGYAILAKRLEARDVPPGEEARRGSTHVTVDAAELTLLLEGIDLSAGETATALDARARARRRVTISDGVTCLSRAAALTSGSSR